MVSRLTLIIFAFGLAFSGLLWHLYTLQLTKGEHYFAQAASQAVLSASRGFIYLTDKDEEQFSAASRKDFYQAYAVPNEIEDVKETVQSLAGLITLSPEEIEKRLSKKGSSYALLQAKISGDAVAKIIDLNIKGIYTKSTPSRFYPFGPVAAHVLGYVGPNESDGTDVGHYGLEKFYNEKLAGKDGVNEGGRIISAEAGENVSLTIDMNIEVEAERILAEAVKTHKAKGGSVIVQDPKTGKILAMGSVPNFDPNTYSEARVSDFLNPVTQTIYEPGSVFKVITMAAGIDAGKITPKTTFYDSGVLDVSGRKIKNWDLKAHGTVTMTQVIEKSLNTGAAYAERQTGDAVFKSYLEKFGFGERTGIDLPGEVRGDLRRLEKGAPAVAYATASFGQGVAVSPLEMINGIATIANGGMLMRPYVNASLEPKEIHRVIRPESAKQVAEMMVSAVDKSEVAKVKGYSIAGKTGTAQVPDFVRGGYSDQVNHTYIGFGPVSDPRFIILIKLDEPAGAPLAGTTVVPAFRDLAQFILNYYNVAPDRTE
jgi:cell division protein FtsI/penicillin-binding protein 2